MLWPTRSSGVSRFGRSCFAPQSQQQSRCHGRPIYWSCCSRRCTSITAWKNSSAAVCEHYRGTDIPRRLQWHWFYVIAGKLRISALLWSGSKRSDAPLRVPSRRACGSAGLPINTDTIACIVCSYDFVIVAAPAANELLLALAALFTASAPPLCPTGLSRQAKGLAPLFRADVPPAGSAETDRLPFYWRRRQFSTRDIENLQREID